MKHAMVMAMIAALAGCSGAGQRRPPAPPSPAPALVSTAPAPTEPASTPPAPPALPPPEADVRVNDAEIVAAQKKVLACTWRRGAPDGDCEAFKAWKELKHLHDGAGDPTLVGFLEDPSPKVRWLALQALEKHGKSYVASKDLAQRIVAVAEKETVELAQLEDLGNVVGHIRVRPTGLWPRVKALLGKPGVPALRRGIARRLLVWNRDDDEVYDATKALVNDADKGVQVAALQAFWQGSNEKHYQETCALWADSLSSANEDLVLEAAGRIGDWQGRCKAQYDKLLDWLEPLAKRGAIKRWEGVSVGSILHDDGQATDAQRARTIRVLRLIAETPANTWVARADVLADLLEYDQAGGRALLTKLTKDNQRFVAERARELLDRKK